MASRPSDSCCSLQALVCISAFAACSIGKLCQVYSPVEETPARLTFHSALRGLAEEARMHSVKS